MIDSLLQSTTVPLLEQVAKFTERRQEILAGNIANINTDDYRMRDLSVDNFQAALKDAIKRTHQQPQLRNSTSQIYSSPGLTGGHSPNDILDLFTPDLFEAVEAPPENLTFQDGNNRSMESEVMEMTKNAMLQRMAIDFLSSQMKLLEHVITERV